MKKLKKRIGLLIICISILSSCGQKSDSDEEPSFWGYSAFAKCSQKYFYIKNDYVMQRTNIMYLDENMNPTYLCSDKKCLHNTYDCCSYEVYGGLLPESIWSYNGKIYVCAPKEEYTYLVEVDPIHYTKKEIFEIGDGKNYGNAYILIFVQDNVYIINKYPNRNEKSGIRKRSLNGRQDEIIYEAIDSNTYWQYAKCFEGKIFCKEYSKWQGNKFGRGILIYDINDDKIDFIRLDNICDFTLVSDSVYYYIANQGLMKYDIQSGEQTQIWQSEVSSSQYRLSYDGKYIYLSDDIYLQQLVKEAETDKVCSITVIDTNGKKINKIYGKSAYDVYFFGDSKYMFGRLYNDEDHSYCYSYIKKEQIEKVSEWKYILQ